MRDETWSLETTLGRLASGDRPRGGHLSNAFARLVRDIGHRMLQVELPLSTYAGVAQHYGFATSLLDFTPDPEVAVFFACTKGMNGRGVVYFQLVENLLNLDCRVLLPPPLYERLVLQRGVFIQVPAVLPKKHFHRIIFPSRLPIKVFRGGRSINLLYEPIWIRKAREFIESWAPDKEVCAFPDLYEVWASYDRAFHLSDKAPRFNPVIEAARWVDHFEDMRYWLASVFSADLEGFKASVLEALHNDNAELATLHRQLAKALSVSHRG